MAEGGFVRWLGRAAASGFVVTAGDSLSPLSAFFVVPALAFAIWSTNGSAATSGTFASCCLLRETLDAVVEGEDSSRSELVTRPV